MFNWFKKKPPELPEAQASTEAPDPKERSLAHRRQGNAWLDKGNLEEAEACYQEAVSVDPQSVDARVNLGYALAELQRFADAQLQLGEAVRLDPNSHDALYILGTVLRAQGHIEQSISAWRKAIALRPDFDICRRDLTRALVESGDDAAAQVTVTDGLALNPGFADFHHYLGNIHANRREFEQAVASYSKALAINQDYAQVHQALGEALKALGNREAAIESHRSSVRLNPASADARARLAAALHDSAQFDAAIATYRQALALDPQHAEVLINLGYALQQHGQLTLAVESYRKAIALRPDFAGAYTNLGDALTLQSKLTEAVDSYRKALELTPLDVRAHNNLAGALLAQGELEAAIAGYEKALELEPGYISAYSNMLFALNYHPDKSAEEIFAAYREFDRRFALPLFDALRGHSNDRQTERRLKVGYVSPDFRRHAARHFVEPLFEHHDRAKVEVYAYADVLLEDAVTAKYRRHADQWVSIRGMTDAEVAERIRADGIDILVDLAGHTGDNRLGIFARKPAPVSLSWMGFGYSTGLSAIDYFLSDDLGAPVGCEALFSERPWRVATPAYVFRPAETMGDIGPLPAVRSGLVTFGTLTRAIRINHRCIRVWSEVLRRVKGSRLVVDSPNYEDAAMQADLAAQFAVQGIGAERLELGFHSPPWDVLRGMDIGLDCFPHNSGTTLFETLYMGVPFVTLASRPSVGRLGSSVLEGVGHSEWIAHTEEEYIEKVVALATDVPRLASLRAGLRAEMEAGPLRDEPAFVRKLETAYKQMFSVWANKQAHIC